MRLFHPCFFAIRHNLFVPPPTKDILWLRATTLAPTIPIENRKHLNCFLSLCVFSWFSPPSSYSFNLVFFIFNGSFSKFFLSLAWMRLKNRSGLLFHYFHLGIIPSFKMPTLTFPFGKFYLLAFKFIVWIYAGAFLFPLFFLATICRLLCRGEFFGRIFEQRFQ